MTAAQAFPAMAADGSNAEQPYAQANLLVSGSVVSAAVSTAQLDKTSDTAPANVPGLALDLKAGKTYAIEGWLATVSGAAGGLKILLTASAGLTASALRIEGAAYDAATAVSRTQVTALTSPLVGSNAIITSVTFKGSITVNAAGTLNVQMAQNTSDATTSSVLTGSTFAAWTT